MKTPPQPGRPLARRGGVAAARRETARTGGAGSHRRIARERCGTGECHQRPPGKRRVADGEEETTLIFRCGIQGTPHYMDEYQNKGLTKFTFRKRLITGSPSSKGTGKNACPTDSFSNLLDEVPFSKIWLAIIPPTLWFL